MLQIYPASLFVGYQCLDILFIESPFFLLLIGGSTQPPQSEDDPPFGYGLQFFGQVIDKFGVWSELYGRGCRGIIECFSTAEKRQAAAANVDFICITLIVYFVFFVDYVNIRWQ